MTRARASLVSVEDTPFYHCIGRCVRRAFLCGYDSVTQRSFEHRREWMQARLARLSETYAIDVCAYTLLSNHYHLVVKLCPERVNDWSGREVVERWTRLFKGSAVARRYLNDEIISSDDRVQLDADIATWRTRLSDLSWFMRCFNEHIARKANAEDDCTGHFWESRFKSQALLDEVGLLTAMAYVDLNPIRAKLAKSIADSDFTSAQDRWEAIHVPDDPAPDRSRPRLLPFLDGTDKSTADPLPFYLDDYFDLLDSSGRRVVAGKRGFIRGESPRLLASLNLDSAEWFATVTQLTRRFELAVGRPETMLKVAARWGKHWLRGTGHAKRLMLPPA